MKKTRKLIPAVAMLMTSAVMMSTASYAWFSMNSEVTAGSMVVQATTDANLYIAKGASIGIDGLTQTAVDDLGVSNTAIVPADMSYGEGIVTVQVPATYSVDPTVGTAGTAATWTTIGTLSQTAGTNTGSYILENYCAYAYVTIGRKATTAATYSLTPSCVVTLGEDSPLNKALRVGLLINNSFYESENTEDVATGSVTYSFQPIAGFADNTAYSACLVVWFEGEDEDCYVNNAVKLANNTAAWTFTSATTTS